MSAKTEKVSNSNHDFTSLLNSLVKPSVLFMLECFAVSLAPQDSWEWPSNNLLVAPEEGDNGSVQLASWE